MLNSNQRKKDLNEKLSYLTHNGFSFINGEEGKVKVLKGKGPAKIVYGEYSSRDKAIKVISEIIDEGMA